MRVTHPCFAKARCRVTFLAACQSQAQAWAYIHQIEGTDYYGLPARATEAECVAEGVGACKLLP